MKSGRQRAILEILERDAIDTQFKLMQALAEQGFHCTQATLSRDIRELKLVKRTNGNGLAAYRPASDDELEAEAGGRCAGVVHGAVFHAGRDHEEAAARQCSGGAAPELVCQRAAQHVLEFRRVVPVPRNVVCLMVLEDGQLGDKRESKVFAQNFHVTSIPYARGAKIVKTSRERNRNL